MTKNNQNYRMTGLRHNPYVGSFHGVNLPLHDKFNIGNVKTVMTESKNNPLVGVFRHAPSISAKSPGMKSMINGPIKPPLFSQMQVNRRPPQQKAMSAKYSFLASLKQIPVSKYSSPANSVSCASVNCECKDDLPLCSICLEPYVDGDELYTLACSHCFHSECAKKWFVTGCLNNEESASFNCPECRQNHVELSEESSLMSGGEGICSSSFLHVGQNLANEGGYDFASDADSDFFPTPVRRKGSRDSFCSDHPSLHDSVKLTPTESGVKQQKEGTACSDGFSLHESKSFINVNTTKREESSDSPVRNPLPSPKNTKLNESGYSDCGFPLAKH